MFKDFFILISVYSILMSVYSMCCKNECDISAKLLDVEDITIIIEFDKISDSLVIMKDISIDYKTLARKKDLVDFCPMVETNWDILKKSNCSFKNIDFDFLLESENFFPYELDSTMSVFGNHVIKITDNTSTDYQIESNSFYVSENNQKLYIVYSLTGEIIVYKANRDTSILDKTIGKKNIEILVCLYKCNSVSKVNNQKIFKEYNLRPANISNVRVTLFYEVR